MKLRDAERQLLQELENKSMLEEESKIIDKLLQKIMCIEVVS